MTAKMFYFHGMRKTTSVSFNSQDIADDIFLMAESNYKSTDVFLSDIIHSQHRSG